MTPKYIQRDKLINILITLQLFQVVLEVGEKFEITRHSTDLKNVFILM